MGQITGEGQCVLGVEQWVCLVSEKRESLGSISQMSFPSFKIFASHPVLPAQAG